MLSRFGRWALGMYPPFAPADLRLTDLRLTDVRPTEHGLTQIVSKTEMSEADHCMLQEFQRQQHATRETVQESMLAREIAEGS